MNRLFALLKRLYRFFEGAYRTAQLHDAASITYTEAEKAVARVLRVSKLPPDCVAATVVNGGSAIVVRHEGASEAFVHKTYALAADQALEWIKKQDLRVGEASSYNRAQRRAHKARNK
jgi:hypothetical protein